MELLVQILILFILIGTVLKLSFNTWWQSVMFGFISALFLLIAYPYAILQSKTQLSDYLVNTIVMQNIAVIVTIDSGIMIAYAFMSLRELFGKPVKPWLMVPLRLFPGLLIFPVLFYLLTQIVFGFPGVRFETIAYGLAALIFVAFPLLSFGFRKLVPETELRYEIHFIVTILVTLLGLLTTVNCNVTYAAAEQPLDVKALLFAVSIFAVLFSGGYLWSKFNGKSVLKNLFSQTRRK
jgi:hypothetical protein